MDESRGEQCGYKRAEDHELALGKRGLTKVQSVRWGKSLSGGCPSKGRMTHELCQVLLVSQVRCQTKKPPGFGKVEIIVDLNK